MLPLGVRGHRYFASGMKTILKHTGGRCSTLLMLREIEKFMKTEAEREVAYLESKDFVITCRLFNPTDFL